MVWAAIRADFNLGRRLYAAQCGPVAATFRAMTSRGLLVLIVQRLDHFLMQFRAAPHRSWGRSLLCLPLRAAVALGRGLAVLIAKADVQASMALGHGVVFSDRGNLVIGAKQIGRGSIIHHRVTVGMDLRNSGMPSIGEDVWIGPDCVLYGDIQIGNGATVLAGSVVTRSVPPRAVVSGNPARVVKRDFDNAGLRKSLRVDVDCVG